MLGLGDSLHVWNGGRERLDAPPPFQTFAVKASVCRAEGAAGMRSSAWSVQLQVIPQQLVGADAEEDRDA
jgi:hypothetical protein